MTFFYEKRNLLDVKDQPTLLHGDFTLDNVKIENGKVSGVFDTEWSFSAHKEYDFVKTKWFMPGGEEFQESFINGYLEEGELSSEFEERVELYEVEKPKETVVTRLLDNLDDQKNDYQTRIPNPSLLLIRNEFKNKDSLKRYIIISEILGKPKALRR